MLTMTTMQHEQKLPSLKELAVRLRPAFEKYHVLQAIVFGSIARGEATRHSDLDLILIQQTDKPFLERYEGILAEITRSISGQDVDVLIYTPQELQQLARRRWLANALKEGKTIYEYHRESPSS